MTLDELAAVLGGVRRQQDGSIVARCPAHDDKKPSLSASEAPDGTLLARCHAGCSFEAIMEAASKRMPAREKRPKRDEAPVVARYDYRDEQGVLLYQVERRTDKRFTHRRPDGKGGWLYSIKGVRRVPYRLPEVLANKDDPLWVVEGEKDADRLSGLGLNATTNSGGAGNWPAEYVSLFENRDLALIPDNDEQGEGHMQAIADMAIPIARSVRIVRLPGLEPKADVSDWLNAGHMVDQLVDLLAASPEAEHPIRLSPAPGRPWTPLTTTIKPVVFDTLEGDIEEPDWIWRGYIARQELGIEAGYTGSGKTTHCIDLAISIATGRPHLDMEPAMVGKVLFVDEEMGLAETRRYFSRLGCSGHENLAVLSERGISLDQPQFIQKLEAALATFRPLFVVLDSLREMLGGTDENDSTASTEMYRRIRWLMTAYGCGFHLLHHLTKPSKDRRWDIHLLRGSGHHANTCSYVLGLKADPDEPNAAQLHTWKRRGGKQGPLLYRFDEGDGSHTAQWRIVYLGLLGEAAGQGEDMPRTRVARAMLGNLEERGPLYWRELKEIAKRVRVSEATFHRAIEKLQLAKRIRQEPGKNGRYYLPAQQELIDEDDT